MTITLLSMVIMGDANADPTSRTKIEAERILSSSIVFLSYLLGECDGKRTRGCARIRVGTCGQDYCCECETSWGESGPACTATITAYRERVRDTETVR